MLYRHIVPRLGSLPAENLFMVLQGLDVSSLGDAAAATGAFNTGIYGNMVS